MSMCNPCCSARPRARMPWWNRLYASSVIGCICIGPQSFRAVFTGTSCFQQCPTSAFSTSIKLLVLTISADTDAFVTFFFGYLSTPVPCEPKASKEEPHNRGTLTKEPSHNPSPPVEVVQAGIPALHQSHCTLANLLSVPYLCG